MKAVAAAALLAGLAAAQTPCNPPSGITISGFSYSGDGCPQGSASTSISTDGTVVTFGFDGFQTYIGPGTSIKDHSHNCELHLNVNYPAGFSFAIIDATYHGYAQLDSGTTATFYSTYYFSETASQTTTTTTSISGGGVWAAGQVYTKEDQTPTIQRSPCGTTAILNVNNRIALSSTDSTASGEVTDDDATVALEHQVLIQWYTC